MKKESFEISSAKVINKIKLNYFMMGCIFLIFTLISILSPGRFSYILIAQLTFSIPLLFVSTLAYYKIAYQKEARLFRLFSWFTNNMANMFLLNVIGLIIAQTFKNMALVYFGVIIFFMFIYSLINIKYEEHTFAEKLFKLLFLIMVLILGGILPSLGLY